MISKILKNLSFQALMSKLLVIYLVYVKGFSILRLFTFTNGFKDTALIAGDMAILSYLLDQILLRMFRRYINVYVSIKNLKTAENVTIFYRDSEAIQKVMLTVSIKCRSKLILNFIKYLIRGDKVILKLKWAHDTWLSFQRINGLLTMNQNSLFYAETDGLCINLFDPLQVNEVEAEIIDTPLLVTCDMGDKTEGEIINEINYITKNKFKCCIVDFLINLWVDVFYVPHKIKVV
ncbi:hypothetical protein [Thermobrachium celere]|uniref:Uncharacterized protein n=1 Tax=Thermobrachium celere DSM 8682 TaxID=941824 RepID=R7RRV2_9CLOT|nr:hypothetical protein [Thermobrachium celere]CDF58794.1 hypothetical protein TCEL_01013 [Thermobrachium celere DSM 8682]